MANVLALVLVNAMMDGVEQCVMILTVVPAVEVVIALWMATVLHQECVRATLTIVETTVNTKVIKTVICVTLEQTDIDKLIF